MVLLDILRWRYKLKKGWDMKKVELKSRVLGNLNKEVSNWPVDENYKNQIVGIINSFVHPLKILDTAKNLHEIIVLSNANTEVIVKKLEQLLTAKTTTIRELILFYQNYSRLIPNLKNDIENFLKYDKNIGFTLELLKCQDDKIIQNVINEANNNSMFLINRENGRRITRLSENLKKPFNKELEVQAKFMTEEMRNSKISNFEETSAQLITIMKIVKIDIP